MCVTVYCLYSGEMVSVPNTEPTTAVVIPVPQTEVVVIADKVAAVVVVVIVVEIYYR